MGLEVGPFFVVFACSPRVGMGLLLFPKAHVRLIEGSKLPLGVSISGDGCLPRLSLCDLVMDRQPAQGVICISPTDSWDRLTPKIKLINFLWEGGLIPTRTCTFT